MVIREIRGVFGLVEGSLCPCVAGENPRESFRRSETRQSSGFTPFRHFTPRRRCSDIFMRRDTFAGL
jgi:hypothetical protein